MKPEDTRRRRGIRSLAEQCRNEGDYGPAALLVYELARDLHRPGTKGWAWWNSLAAYARRRVAIQF